MALDHSCKSYIRTMYITLLRRSRFEGMWHGWSWNPFVFSIHMSVHR